MNEEKEGERVLWKSRKMKRGIERKENNEERWTRHEAQLLRNLFEILKIKNCRMIDTSHLNNTHLGSAKDEPRKDNACGG